MLFTQDEIIVRLIQFIADRHRGRQTSFARSLGVSDAFVSGILTGKRKPSGVVLEAINARPVTLYRIESDLNESVSA